MKLLNLVNLAALICVITRYSRTKCTNCQAEMFNPSLPVQTKVAAVVYIALLLTIFLLAVVFLEGVQRQTDPKVMEVVLLVALPLMAIRSGYAAYPTFSGGLLVPKNVWIKLVVQCILEYGACAVLTALGFMVGKAREVREYDLEEGSNGSGTPMKVLLGLTLRFSVYNNQVFHVYYTIHARAS